MTRFVSIKDAKSDCGCPVYMIRGHRLEHLHGRLVTGVPGWMMRCVICNLEVLFNWPAMVLARDEWLENHLPNDCPKMKEI